MTSAQETKTTNLFSRLRSYSRELYALDKRPLIDQTFSFPWKELAEELKRTFGCDVSISPGALGWKTSKELSDEIVAPTISINIAIPGVKGQIQLILSRSDIERFMGHILYTDSQTLLQQDPSFFDQFLIFFSTELLACAQGLKNLQQLSPRLTTSKTNESPGSLCQDINLSFLGQPALARLIIPPDFLDAWRTFRLGNSTQSSSLSEIEMNLCIEGGRTFLTTEEISSLQQGDVILLDHPFFIPGSPKSRVFLTQGGHPLFRAKVEEGAIKILEMPLQHEAFLPLGGFSMAAKQSVFQKNQAEPVPSSNEEETEISQDSSLEKNEEETIEWEEGEEKESTPLTEAEIRVATGISSNLSKEPLNINQLPLTVVV